MEKIINKESNFVSVVLYLHKEDSDITFFLDTIYKVLATNFKKYEMICVNDKASSSVIEQIKSFKEDKNELTVSIVNMGFQHGLEASMNAGIDLAIGDYVFEFDASYVDYEASLIMDVYYKAMQGYDIVSAILPRENSKFMSRAFYYLYNHFSEDSSELVSERFRVISRRGINRISSFSKTIPYRKAIYAASGLNLAAVEYESSVNVKLNKNVPRDVTRGKTAMDALVLFTDLAYKSSIFLSIVMAGIMLGSGCYTIIAYFGQNKPVAGWAPLMGLISLGFLAIFLLMTFLFKYLDVLVRLIFKRQKYLISSIEKI